MRPAFLDRFEHVTPNGDERWRAECPLCGKPRSLSFFAGRDRWIVKCFAGHRPNDVLAQRDLIFDDLLYQSEYTSAVQTPPPTPPNERARKAEPELRMLLREHRAGRARLVPVEMPALAPDTPLLARLIYEEMALRWALRLGADMPEDRPLPYAVSEPVTAGWCAHPAQASRAVHWLEDHGLIWSPGATPVRGDGIGGTRTFLPGPRPSGPLPQEACRVEAAASVRRAVGVEQPHVEPVDDVAVGDAVVGGALGLVAAERGAVSVGTPHRSDSRSAPGDDGGVR